MRVTQWAVRDAYRQSANLVVDDLVPHEYRDRVCLGLTIELKADDRLVIDEVVGSVRHGNEIRVVDGWDAVPWAARLL